MASLGLTEVKAGFVIGKIGRIWKSSTSYWRAFRNRFWAPWERRNISLNSGFCSVDGEASFNSLHADLQKTDGDVALVAAVAPNLPPAAGQRKDDKTIIVPVGVVQPLSELSENTRTLVGFTTNIGSAHSELKTCRFHRIGLS